MNNNENKSESSKIDFNSEFIWMVVLLAIFGGKKMNRNKILTMTKLEMSDGRKISCTLTWEEEKNVVIFHRSSYFEALKNKSINPKYFSEEAYKILDMIEYREIYDAGSLLQLGMYADLYDYNVILDQFKLMYRLYGWTFKDA